MKNMKKVLMICLCVVIVATVTVAGTLAWLLDTDAVVNTFTVGHVDITVDESLVNEDGTPVPGAERVKENTYHLLPGMTYTKDPTMTIKANSEDAYVRMILKVHNASDVQAILSKYDLGEFSTLIGGWDPEVWLYKGFTEDAEADTISFEFRYQDIAIGGEEDAVLPALFDTLIAPGQMTTTELKALYEGGFKMEIFGHAIQAAGFASDDQAWESFDEQVNE